jgi:hypothetical protein
MNCLLSSWYDISEKENSDYLSYEALIDSDDEWLAILSLNLDEDTYLCN